jgi:hypothetical protein
MVLKRLLTDTVLNVTFLVVTSEIVTIIQSKFKGFLLLFFGYNQCNRLLIN